MPMVRMTCEPNRSPKQCAVRELTVDQSYRVALYFGAASFGAKFGAEFHRVAEAVRHSGQSVDTIEQCIRPYLEFIPIPMPFNAIVPPSGQ